MIEVLWKQTTYMDDIDMSEKMQSIEMAQRFVRLCEQAAPGKEYLIHNPMDVTRHQHRFL